MIGRVAAAHGGRLGRVDGAPACTTRAASGILTFLIADVRGYTSFTQRHGDEAAARLAAAFAEVAREGVEAHGGEVIELRGDEALAVFESPRDALRAAVELQLTFADETALDPTLPLRVGIGLDAGEAVPVDGGYRGGAFNLAARLCSQARAGEVWVSQGVAHIARAGSAPGNFLPEGFSRSLTRIAAAGRTLPPTHRRPPRRSRTQDKRAQLSGRRRGG